MKIALAIAGVVALSASLLLSGRDSAASAELQLIQSVPVETQLAHPGILHAAPTWVEMIRGARKSIDLCQMYVSHETGQALDAVLSELEAAARRQVRIRIILSKNMIDTDPAALGRLRAIPGAELRIMDLSKTTGGIQHAKYWIIDEEKIFIGSQNLDWKALSHIHEMGVLLSDPKIAGELSKVFESDWKFCLTGPATTAAENPVPAAPAQPLIQLVASPARLNPPGIQQALPSLLALIHSSKKTIHIQLLDYGVTSTSSGAETRWTVIDDALRAAAARGVTIELLVSHWNASLPKLDDLKSLARVPGIQIRVVTIPQARQGVITYARVIHSKYMVIDGELLWLGTSNWSRGYFEASRNVELILRLPEQARIVEEIFQTLRNSPYAETVSEETKPRPRW